MNQFIAGVPLVTFINCQTKEEIQMNYIIEYNKYNDEIVFDQSSICYKEYSDILNWLLSENFVKVKLNFNVYTTNMANLCAVKTGEYYEENYPVVMVYKPFVKSSCHDSAGIIEFKIKVRE